MLAYARRGHGRSEAKPPYDVDTLVEDLRQVLGLTPLQLAPIEAPRIAARRWTMG